MSDNTAQEPLLRIEDLHVKYVTSEDTNYAVNGVDFEIQAGQVFALVGETGAGKTTTALSILQLLPKEIGQITKGKIFMDGKDLMKLPEADLRKVRGKRVSMIFQDPMTSLNPVLTVGRQIGEAIEMHNALSKQEVEEKVDSILELVGIPASRKHEYPHQFSGGMKQRVVIAMALVCEPALLIADEPTTALDVTVQNQVLKLMNELKQRLNTSMLLITHDLGIVAQMCDVVAIMYAGEIIEIGTVYDIFDKSPNHHPYTNGLFGSLPSLQAHSKRLKPIEGLMPDPTDLPSGCKFHTRCPQCFDTCKTDVPENFTQGTHQIKCHLFQQKSKEDR